LESILTVSLPISEIGILSEEERQQLLIEWNDTECEWWSTDEQEVGLEEEEEEEFGGSAPLKGGSAPLKGGSAPPSSCSTTVHELFEEQVKKTPDSIAVVFEDEQVTYRELNTRANQLAHYLS